MMEQTAAEQRPRQARGQARLIRQAAQQPEPGMRHDPGSAAGDFQAAGPRGRESYREAGKVKNRTLANLSSWPEAKVDALARVLKGQPPPAADLDEASGITRSLPHGRVAAVLGTARQLGLDELIDPVPSRHRDLVTAMAVAQVIAPDSKLAIARGLRDATAASSLGEILGVGSCDEDDLYAAMGLPARPAGADPGRAGRPAPGRAAPWCCMTCPVPRPGADLPAGRHRPPQGLGPRPAADRLRAADLPRGHPGRDRGLRRQHRGPESVAAQVTRVKDRFGITKVVLVGDRGMLTAARLREDVGPAGLDWITALRAPQVKKLVRGGDLQLTLFAVQDLAEITSPDFPGERLVACKNPFGEAERARKRESLLAATEADLEKIAAACARARAPLRGQDTIAVRVDRVLNRRKVARHSTVDIGEDHLSYARNQDSIAAEAALDGIYVLRTSVASGDLDGPQVVSSYKALAQVERLQYRPGHPPDPAPHRGPGAGARVLADAVVLPQLAYAGPARAAGCPASGSSPPRPLSSGRPSSCSASATASGPRSQQPGPHSTKAQVNGTTRGSLGGTTD
jgi:hypothetical protein